MSYKISFEFIVEFIEEPNNCGVCDFKKHGICIKEDKLICGNGLNGYFVIQEVREV